MRSWVGVGPGSMSRTVRSGWSFRLLSQQRVLGGDEQPAAVEVCADGGPVEVGFGEQQHGVGRQLPHQLPGRLQERDGLRSETHEKGCVLRRNVVIIHRHALIVTL